MSSKKSSIQAQLLMPLLLTLVLLVGGFAAAIFSIQKFNLESSSDELIRTASSAFEHDLAEQQELLSSLQRSIVEDPVNIELLANSDRDGLYSKNKALFNHLKIAHSVTHFYFHSVEGVNIIRIHHPQRFGDHVQRFTMTTALQTGKKSWGIELGPLGIFTLRVVLPVFKDNTLVGYLELGKEIEELIQRLETNHNVKAAFLIDKGFLNRQTWESGMGILRRESDWHLMSNHVLSYPSQTKLSQDYLSLLIRTSNNFITDETRNNEEQKDTRLKEFHEFGGEPFLSVKLPLIDAAGNRVGRLVMLKSNKSYVEKVDLLVFWLVVVTSIITFILVLFLRKVLSAADSRIEAQNINLIESQALLKNAQRIAKIGSWVLDHKQRKLSWSAETYRIFGVEPERFTLTLDSFLSLIHPEDKTAVTEAFSQSLQKQSEYQVTHRIVTSDNSVKHVHERCETDYDSDGSPLLSKGTVQDITELVEAEKALYESEEKHRSLLNNSTSVIYMKDLEGHYLFINRKFEELFNVKNDEVEGKNDFDIFPSDVAVAFRDNDSKVIESGETIQTEEEVPQDDGKHTYISVKFPIFDRNGETQAVCGISTDITERIRAEEKILHQAHYDALTNLPNRLLVLDRLGQLLNESERTEDCIAVVFIDLDDFKKIDDSMGHESGDKLLIEAAKRLSKVVRLGDTVGRLGGDEFIILLNNLSRASDARPVVEKLLRIFRQPFLINDRELILTTTAGIAVHPNDGDTPSELLRNADSAMYHAKSSGRNTYSFFTEAMNKGISRRLEIEEQLHGALDRNEMSVHYQSQIDVESGEIIGCEALVRWNNEQLGNISPGEFISIAEQTGDILAIGEFVLRQAVILWSEIKQRTGRAIRVAVNLSPRQFREPKLAENIIRLLNANNMSGEYLEMEITEGVLLSGQGNIRDTFSQLQDKGIVLTLDDFGTGYSSLSYLRKYSFGVLKIDKSFINDVLIDPADSKLVEATIAMSHALDLKVVAEGIETLEQFNMLKSFGCDIAQGFYFARPVNKEMFIANYLSHGS